MPKAASHNTSNRRSFVGAIATAISAAAFWSTRSVAAPAAAADSVPEPPMLKARFERFANAFLTTDVAFLAADDEHIVITLRIPRDKLALNHSMLSVLSDYAGE